MTTSAPRRTAHSLVRDLALLASQQGRVARSAAEVLPEAGNAADRALRQGPLQLAATATALDEVARALGVDRARVQLVQQKSVRDLSADLLDVLDAETLNDVAATQLSGRPEALAEARMLLGRPAPPPSETPVRLPRADPGATLDGGSTGGFAVPRGIQQLASLDEPLPDFLTRDCEVSPLAELLRVRNELSRLINRRFKRKAALVFTDMVGSTTHYQRFGDESGQGLMLRQMELLKACLPLGDGFIVHHTGDGAFCCFPGVDAATRSMIELQNRIARDNVDASPDLQLAVRVGIHWGEVLADGQYVTGDSVNVAARVTTLAGRDQIVMSQPALQELDVALRPPTRPLPPTPLKGLSEPMETVLLEWREQVHVPRRVIIVETGQEHALPDRDVVSFGRMEGSDSERGNDIVLSHPDPSKKQRLSRWQFTLHRTASGLRLRVLSDRGVSVDGHALVKGQESPVGVGCTVTVADILTLQFLADVDDDSDVTGHEFDADRTAGFPVAPPKR